MGLVYVKLGVIMMRKWLEEKSGTFCQILGRERGGENQMRYQEMKRVECFGVEDLLRMHMKIL